MIVARGSTVACLGGWRGGRLFLRHEGGEFRCLAELDWDSERQLAPQRRLLLTDDAVWILEPVEGGLLQPPLRVRRFDLNGSEVGREEGEEEVSDLDAVDWIHFHAWDKGPGRLLLRHVGIDVERGRALQAWVETDSRMPHPTFQDAGVPLRCGTSRYYALRARGLLRLGPEGSVLYRGEASLPTLIGGRACAAGQRDGRNGVWVDGTWRPLPGPHTFSFSRMPLTPVAAPHGAGGLAVLRREGGALGVLDGPPASLPAGLYSALLALPEGLFAVTETETPSLVPAAF